jgi:hypothetical protein
MNDGVANLRALEPARPPREDWLAVPKPPREGWSGTRWLAVILLAFAAHAGFILTFGENKTPAPRAVINVPTLGLAHATDELVALNDPTLFARPQHLDFAATAGLNLPEVKPPSFRWTEPPRWLPLAADGLGAAFGEFLQTNFFAGHQLDFKPAQELSTPGLPVEPALAQNSTMQIEGGLAQRELPSEISLTNWPYPDVLAPCMVQVLVDAAGNVVSAVVLPSENGLTADSHYEAADQRALEVARALRFKPASQPTVGQIIFNWHTVPVVPATASP